MNRPKPLITRSPAVRRDLERNCTKRRVQGLTLIEVMVAVSILAVIATISYQTLSITIASKDVVEAKLKEMARVDRAWLLLETDLKNNLSYERKQMLGPGSGELILPLLIERNGDYSMVLLRGGHPNPMNFPRSELIRVGYRLQDETLWRDVWYNLGSVDQDEARQQKIVDGVESFEISVLSDRANSFSSGPWLDSWTLKDQSNSKMPLALKITIKLEGYEEISRLYSLLRGE
ncbi:Type II secretion system protein J [Thalassocella blandensis]|nr:Type II secretion system protein J [Thalassocella blandensis]